MIPNMSELSIGCNKGVYTHVNWYTRGGKKEDSDDDSDADPDVSDDATIRQELKMALEQEAAELKAGNAKGVAGGARRGVKVENPPPIHLYHPMGYSDHSTRRAADAASKVNREKKKRDKDKRALEDMDRAVSAERKRRLYEENEAREQRYKALDPLKQQQDDWADDVGLRSMGRKETKEKERAKKKKKDEEEANRALLEEANRALLEEQDAAEKNKQADEMLRQAQLRNNLLCISSDIEGGPNALLLTESMRKYAESYASGQTPKLLCRYIHGGDAGDIRNASLGSIKYLNQLGDFNTKLCGNRDANVVRFNELFLPPGKTLVPLTPNASNQIKNFYADVLHMDKDLGNDYTMTSHRANCRQLILIYGWHRLSRGTINPTFNSSTHIDVANSHFSEFTELDKKPDNELVGTEGLSNARALMALLTAFVSLYQARTGTETHIKELKQLFEDIVKIPDVQLQCDAYVANALKWAKELATYVESSNALSHSYVGGDQVLGVHDFFGKEGGRVGQVFKNAANIQATESELYEACDPEAFTPEDWVEDWVKQANRRHRDIVKNSQALQAIADSDPTQESKTPDQDHLLARLADPQSDGFFHGLRPMDYVHTLCKQLQLKFKQSPVKHVFCGHQPRPLGRLTRSKHGLILAELDTQYTLFCATSYVIIPNVDPSRGTPSTVQEPWAQRQVSGLAVKIKKYKENQFIDIANVWALGSVRFNAASYRVVRVTLPNLTYTHTHAYLHTFAGCLPGICARGK